MTIEEQPAIEQLLDENAQLLSFLYACPVGLVEMSSNGAISMINPLAMQLLLRLHPTPAMNIFTSMAAYGPELRNLVENYSQPQGTVCEDHRILVHAGQTPQQPNNEVFSCTVIKLGPERFMLSVSDISKQVSQERKLKEAGSWFATLLDSARDFGVASLDKNGQIESVNSSISQQTGFDKEDLIGQTLDFLASPPVEEATLTAPQQLALAAREGWHLNADWQRHKDGSRVWYQRLVAVRHEHREGHPDEIPGYTVVLREGREESVDAYQLRQMLLRDHLTGAYNRMHFFEVAERECIRKKRYAQPLSLVMVDIDFFKQVNDAHGHAAGDSVLKQFTRRCMSMLRPVDTLARVGGEEFAIILPSTDLEGARLLAERLRSDVANTPVTVNAKTLNITASFGCAELGSDTTLSPMMEVADAALYEAKLAGRNRVVARRAKT